jgi:subtilisin family serine protease
MKGIIYTSYFNNIIKHMKKNRRSGAKKYKLTSHINWALFLIIAFGSATLLISEITNSTSTDYRSLLSRVFTEAEKEKPISVLSRKEFANDHILIKFKDTVSKGKKDEVLSKNKLKEKEEIKQIGVKLVSIDPSEAPQSVVERIKKNHSQEVEFAELDEKLAPSLIPNDPKYSSQWYLSNTQAPSAWDLGTCSENVTIAILDTGTEVTHSDLAGKIVPGWDFYNNISGVVDPVGHGTATAGVAGAAGNNGVGISSYAWKCKIMPLRIGDSTGYALYSTAAKALTYAADHGVRVANISYKFTGSSAITSAAQYFQNKTNGVVTISAGNEGDFISTADNPYVLTVSATNSSNTIASWSTRGNQIDISAPGASITTTNYHNSYATWNGTSFSAPIVAGVAALVISANPNLNSNQIQSILKTSATDLGVVGWDPLYGSGKVNAYKAVQMAKSYITPSPSPSSSPTPSPSVSPSPTVTPLPSPTVSPSPSPSPSISPSPSPSPIQTLSISNVSVTSKTANQAVIKWTTNIPTVSYLKYGLSSSNIVTQVSDPNITTSHSVTVTGLSANTRYYYKVWANTSDNTLKSTSSTYNFRTNKK